MAVKFPNGIAVGAASSFSAPLAMGSNKITGLANGTASGDALHFGQIGVSGGVQGYDATLAALGGVTSAANTLPYFTGVDTASVAALSTPARAALGLPGADGWNLIPYFNSASSASTAVATATGLALLGATDAAAARTTLNAP